MNRTLSRALFTLVAAMAAGSSLADEFIIRVPVEVRSLMPEVAKVCARCDVLDAAGKQITINAAGHIAQGFTTRGQVDATGSFSGTLEAKFTTPSGIAAKAVSYRCYLLPLGSNDVILDDNLSDGDRPTDVSKPKPGTMFVVNVTGRFPAAATASGS